MSKEKRSKLVARRDLALPGSMKKKMIFADATPRKEADAKTKTVDGVVLQNRMSTGEEIKSEGEMG
ncbi:hypothetical protein N7491_002508 [Penicillium cf. griseofulvum]|uniref:Uncharacterized protein n=1 Tax=Penicillium cf. griseofulvum TaxID=2972120 RepID=A0A9W9MSZ1_9EURO|nr:hypothetical protein N7472_003307 [Penicillium cf. griseofulvum]KAJ5446426.1 hypothetical protein N7491_002508 [Penicillium cf. griseofulvum]KAJ5448166.1 hypothetical protein N7445_002987 [Penicillium cf. griseofulvum]